MKSFSHDIDKRKSSLLAKKFFREIKGGEGCYSCPNPSLRFYEGHNLNFKETFASFQRFYNVENKEEDEKGGKILAFLKLDP